MIIQDRSEELNEGLKASYKRKIEVAIKEAQDGANHEADQYLEVEQSRIENYSKQNKSQIQDEYKQRVASTKLDLETELADCKSQLVKSMIEHLSFQATKLSSEEKIMLTKRMYQRIIQQIRDQGFKQKDFTIYTWRGAKIKGCVANQKELTVRAESKDVLIEDSITDLLDSHHNEIIRIVSRHIEEQLN